MEINPLILLAASAAPSILIGIPATEYFLRPALIELKELQPDLYDSIEGELFVNPKPENQRRSPLKVMTFILSGRFRDVVNSDSLRKKLATSMWMFRAVVVFTLPAIFLFVAPR